MAANRVELAHQHLITPSPTPWMILGRQDATSSKMNSFTYPKCRDDPAGPCEMQSSSSKACKEEFPDIKNFYRQRYCKCTNGYYSLSSQCWVDCYRYGATTTDLVSLSRDLRLASLECESNSLAMESEDTHYKSLSDNSKSRESAASQKSATATTTAGSEVNTGNILSGSITRTGASEGATAASGIVPETVSFVDRPTSTSTGQAQQEGGGPPQIVRAARCNALFSVTAVLALLSVFHGL